MPHAVASPGDDAEVPSRSGDRHAGVAGLLVKAESDTGFPLDAKWSDPTQPVLRELQAALAGGIARPVRR